MSKSNFTNKGPVYGLPPRIIGGSVKVFGRTIAEILSFLLATLVALFYLIVIPFPDVFSLRLVIAVGLFVAVVGYMLIPLAGMSGLEWTFALLRYKNSHIPKRTRARPSPPGRYANLARLRLNASASTSQPHPRRISLTGSSSASSTSAVAGNAEESESESGVADDTNY